MKTTATLPTWAMVAADAHHRRQRLYDHVRSWAARAHLESRSVTSTRTIAALDALSRPVRTSIAAATADTTDRDRAEAASDDLWDAVAVVWSLVGSVKSGDVPALEHVLAELAECGRWLAAFPVIVARHDQEIDRLFREDKP